MKSAIRLFALIVALAGLASAAFFSRRHPRPAQAHLDPREWPHHRRHASAPALHVGMEPVWCSCIESLISLDALPIRRLARKCQRRGALLCLRLWLIGAILSPVRRFSAPCLCPLNPAMSAMNAGRVSPLGGACRSFLGKGLHRRFPAMGYYLMLRAISAPLLLFVLHERIAALGARPIISFSVRIYYFGFFATYLAAAVLLFFICIEVFRSALAPFPGIAKLAIVIFRWAAMVSVIVSLSSDLLCAQGPSHRRGHLVWPHALGQHSRVVPAGLPLPEHERAAPDGARSVLWHRTRLWRDVVG